MRSTRIALVAMILSAAASHAFAQQAPAFAPPPQQGAVPGDLILPATDPLGRAWTPSAWREREKAFYSDLLAKGRFDFLVVPFQVSGYAVSRSTRSLMTAQLAMAIAVAAKAKVPDPYLVARALGDGVRVLEPKDVYRLAARLGVRRIVWGYVGHDAFGMLRLTIQHWDRQGTDAPGQEHPLMTTAYAPVAFTEEAPATEAFQKLLPSVLQTLGLKPPEEIVGSSMRPAPKLPAAPSGMFKAQADPVRDAYYFQLLAALTPWNADRVRERFVEKSYIASVHLRKDAAAYRVLKARAYYYLGLRPAAIALLGTPKTAEERYFLAFLNGNLPSAEALARKLPTGMAQFIAQLEVNSMAAAYGVRTQQDSAAAATALALPGMAWPLLAARAVVDWDKWAQIDNIVIKALLDLEFPIAGFSAEDLVRGAASLADPSRLQASLNLSVLEHERRLLTSDHAQWCCQPLRATPAPLDYLDLIEGIGADNLMRRAYFFTYIQGNPESALSFLSQIERAYKDYPQFALARAQADAKVAETAEGASKSGLIQSAASNAANAMYWEQGQTPAAADAFNFVAGLAGAQQFQLANFYAGDIPYRSFYPEWAAGGQMEIITNNSLTKLRNSAFDFQPVTDLAWSYGELQKKQDKVDELLKSIEGRFAGHPARPLMLAQYRLAKGDVAGAERYYREGIRLQPGDWSGYFELGRMLFEDGKTSKAAELFGSYPGFTPGAKQNPVAVSNQAYQAGNLFYWTGHFEDAVPLFKIAADLQTGSEASLSSEARIRLLEGDFSTALQLMLQRGQRYNSSYAFRDYFGLLHGMSRSEQAWPGFNMLAVQSPAPHIWETAVVGQRLAGLGEEQVFAWAKQDAMRSAGAAIGYASLHLLRSGTMDRVPSANLPDRIAEIERPVWQLQSWHGMTARPYADGSREAVLGPATAEGDILPTGVFNGATKTHIHSDLYVFAKALRAMRLGNYAAADAELREAAAHYDLSTVSLGYLLPYYALAAARSGRSAAVATYLNGVPQARRRFDYYLAKAMLAGVAGRHEDALRHLRAGLHRRPYTEFRPLLVEYQYGELCDLLYEATQVPGYRDEALQWAKRTQSMQPWFAWSYAMEAKYATDSGERGRAIAMAYYLDRNSELLSKLPKKEVEAAIKEFSGRNPLLRSDDALKDKAT